MEKFEFITEKPLWFLLFCIAAGVFYAWLLYSKKNEWSPKINLALFIARFFLVSILSFLLLSPLTKKLENIIEKPTIAILVDNSASIIEEDSSLAKTISDGLMQMKNTLSSADYQVFIHNLDGRLNNKKIDFNLPFTNISDGVKSIENQYQNGNLQSIILVSDGINNMGLSPEYLNTNSPVFSLGVGDTNVYKDVAIEEVYYNKIAYSGNKFPIKVKIKQTGFDNKKTFVKLFENNQLKERREVILNAVSEVDFLVSSSTSGKRLFRIEIETLDGEKTSENNVRDIYIQIIEAKERVLIYAHAPHPDIKAIKSALDSKENIEVEYYYKGFLAQPKGKYDLIILHNISAVAQEHEDLVKEIPLFYIIGNQSDIETINKNQSLFKITLKSQKNDVVSAYFNSNFSGFKMEGGFSKNPPLEVFFGELEFSSKHEIILQQKVGTVETEKPIMAFVEDGSGQKSGFFIGEGLWKWRLYEYLNTENSKNFDELISKSIMYLTAKKDKRKLKITPLKEEFFTNENIGLEAEVFNDIYEKLYQKEITLEIQRGAEKPKKYSFINSESNKIIRLGTLESGLYNYKAYCKHNNETFADEGAFAVRELYLEKTNTRADFELLQRISKNSEGQFFPFSEREKLIQLLTEKPHPSKIILQNETYMEWINLHWLLFFIAILASLEWAARKYLGTY